MDTTPRDPDGGYDGYESIPGGNAVSKNVLTVGAIWDLQYGYNDPTDIIIARFSSWGPTDDGRIKPDIVANGTALRSTDFLSDSSYYHLSGTSQAAPNVTGSLALLQLHYQNNHNGQSMKAATLKALVLHTADKESTDPGPNYRCGWGLLNTTTAAEMISKDQNDDFVIQELSLIENTPYSITVHSNGIEPLFATIVWTDPPGTPPDPQLNPTTPMLVNDLDLRITRNSDGQIFYPWRLVPQNPSLAATHGDNSLDNVEQVYIETPTHGDYTVTVNHKNTLQNGSQDFAMIITSSATDLKLWVSSTLLDFGLKNTRLTFDVRNLGCYTLTWNITNISSSLWITSISPLNGKNDTTVTVIVDRSKLRYNNSIGRLRIVSNAGQQDVEIKVAKNYPTNWNFNSNTNNSALIKLPVSANPNIQGIPLALGDYVGAFTPMGLCCGFSQWQNEDMAITVWGDNPLTVGTEGFKADELVCYRVFQVDEQQEWNGVEVGYSAGSGYYSPDSTMVLNKFDVKATRTITLDFYAGWNIISINVIPADLSIDAIMNPIVNDLVIVKNGMGQSYIPSLEINEIGQIDFKQGYQVNLNNSCTLNVTGLPVNPTTPIYLSDGWSMISYLPEIPIEVAVALSSIVDNLIVAKDNGGRIFIPQFNLNTIGQMQPNQGYQISMDSSDTLIYPGNSILSQTMIAQVTENDILATEHFHFISRTGENAIIVITKDNPPKYSDGQLLEIGDEIGLFTPSGISCGAVVWQGMNTAVTVWGDDSQTDEVDGFKHAEKLNCRVWQKSTDSEYFALLNFQGDYPCLYQPNGFFIVKELKIAITTQIAEMNESSVPSEFKLMQNYPNPFNLETIIEYQLPEPASVQLNVFDLRGCKIKKLVNELRSAGYHTILWNGKDETGRSVASGVYLYQIEAKGQDEKQRSFIDVNKMILIK